MFVTRSVAVCKSNITVMAKKVSIGEDGRLSFSSMNCDNQRFNRFQLVGLTRSAELTICPNWLQQLQLYGLSLTLAVKQVIA